MSKNKEKLREFIGLSSADENEGNARPKKEKKPRRSVFMMTINSQKSIDEMSLREKNRFKMLVGYLFDEDGIYGFIRERDGYPELADNAVSFRDDYSYEIGEKFSKVHMHGVVDIEHNSFIFMDIPALRTFVNEYLGYNSHINVKTPGQNAVVNWENYMNKNQW